MILKTSLMAVAIAATVSLTSTANAALDPISDTFQLLSGNNVIETLIVRESEEGRDGVFKTFALQFAPGTAVESGLVIAPGEPRNRVSDTVGVIPDPANLDKRLIVVFSDGDNNALPGVVDPGEYKRFRLFNFLGNPMPKDVDAIAVYSGLPVPEPGTWALMLAGLLVMVGVASRTARR